MGALESPSILKFEFRANPEKHVVLLSVRVHDQNAYFADLKRVIDQSSKRDAFIFLHGYNVTFEDAARRTAQMAYDLGFSGAPIFYSWPSQGTPYGYVMDEQNVEWATHNLKRFLDDFSTNANAQNIFLIAHSMGARALTMAFSQLIVEKPNLRNRFREIILSAPDIDAEVFKRDIVPRMAPLTLYASSRDRALSISKSIHGYPRAGESGAGMVIMQGIETIDATSVATDFLGHSYFAEARSVIADMFYLIRDGKRPKDRFGLHAGESTAGPYWIFKP
jgi:esterase/lipase superfamily enzyme